jgi:hypothetical protein
MAPRRDTGGMQTRTVGFFDKATEFARVREAVASH